LTEREKEILKSIGIRPNGKPKTLPRRLRGTRAPEPYTLEVTIHCQLCGGTPVKYFDMVLAENAEAPHLHAFPISKGEALQRPALTKKDTYQSTCCECYRRLHKWSKEELVEKLIKVYPLASIGAGK
jgi:hypothetical protein